MAWNETKTTVSGWVCTDIRARQLSDGGVGAFFSISANERKYDSSTGTWSTGNRLHLKVKCFRRLADNVVASLRKGDPVVVTGKIYTNQFDIDGQSREEIELEATSIGPDLSLCQAELRRGERADAPVEAVAA